MKKTYQPLMARLQLRLTQLQTINLVQILRPPGPASFQTEVRELLGNRRKLLLAVGLGLLIFGCSVFLLSFIYAGGVDWNGTFSGLPQHWRDPFELPFYTNAPWTLFLLPHAWLPPAWSNAVNLVLNMAVLILVIWRYGGGWVALVLTFTSPAMLDLARTNNIDWIPLLAFLVPPESGLGLPLLAVKPQVLGGAGLIWLKKGGLKSLVPGLILLGLSFVVWGWWPGRAKLPDAVNLWNFSPWPFAIPLGLYLLYRAFRTSDEILAAGATPFLSPYFAPYSLAGLIALLACKYQREAFYVYVGLWTYTIVEQHRLPVLLRVFTGTQ